MITIGARDASVMVGTLTVLMIISGIGGIIATGDLTGMVTGKIAGTRAVMKPGIAATGRRSYL